MRLLPLTVAAAVLLSPGPARAEPASTGDARPLDESLQGPAKEAYAYARTLFDHSDFAGAFAKYRQAYDLSKDPRLLFDMALCERNLRAYARMQALLVQYESASGAALSPADRRAVDSAIAASRSLVGTLTVQANEAGATVTVDGEDVGATPLAQPVTLDLGKHTVVVRKAGFDPVERSIDVAGGAQVSVDVAMSPRPSATAHLIVIAESDALVSVDQSATARGTFDGVVSPGAHAIDVTAPGKRAYHAELSFHGGETRSLHVSLDEERRGAAVWPWIVGGAVVAAGAATGGYFLLKSQQGSPAGPAGQLGTVQFQLSRAR